MPKNDVIIKYSLVDSGELESDHWAIRIDNGAFKDVIYQYMVVEFIEEAENLRTSYKYNIIEDSNNLVESKRVDFEEVASNILDAILHEEHTKGKNGTNRINDIEESNT